MVKENKCVICGCTTSKACEGGCGWSLVDNSRGIGVCSKCVPDPILWIKEKWPK